jgi:hypothetical protein
VTPAVQHEILLNSFVYVLYEDDLSPFPSMIILIFFDFMALHYFQEVWGHRLATLQRDYTNDPCYVILF